jgi:two-component system response regulator AtoC
MSDTWTRTELRKKAEQLVEAKHQNIDSLAISDDQLKEIIHELQVHQIELEMQNDELRTTHLELQESRDKYDFLYNSAPVGYFTLDARGVVLQVNQTGANLLGKVKSLLIKMPFFVLVYPSDRARFQQFLKRLLETNEREACEIRLNRHADQIEVWLQGITARDPTGIIKHVQLIVSDRTALKKAEQAVLHTEERFRAVCESTKDIIIIKDLSGSIQYVNRSAEKMLGLPRTQLTNRKMSEVLPDKNPEHDKELDQRVGAGESIEEERTRVIRNEQSTFLETRIPMRSSSDGISGILCIFRDITDRKRKEHADIQVDMECLSKAMRETLVTARKAAVIESIILLLGESGSGKDHLAKYIHQQSRRSGGPFFAINCAALTESLAESELFGHERGAFTGAQTKKRGLLELAEGGTILLNEIGELSPLLQAKLLTFLDTKKITRVGGEKSISVNARIIAATNRDLEKEVEEKRFRQDLFYRLNVITVRIPALRERREDIPILVSEIMNRLKAELQLGTLPEVPESAMEALQNYDWPGNVRELRNILERSLMISGNKKLRLDNLGLPSSPSTFSDWNFTTQFPHGLSLNEVTRALKRSLIMEALRRSSGSRQDAAAMLEISRYSLKHYMKSLDIPD